MDKERLLELLAHYVVMLFLVFGGLAVITSAVGDLGFWAELVIVVVIAFSYRPIVVRLGVAPAAWESR